MYRVPLESFCQMTSPVWAFRQAITIPSVDHMPKVVYARFPSTSTPDLAGHRYVFANGHFQARYSSDLSCGVEQYVEQVRRLAQVVGEPVVGLKNGAQSVVLQYRHGAANDKGIRPQQSVTAEVETTTGDGQNPGKRQAIHQYPILLSLHA